MLFSATFLSVPFSQWYLLAVSQWSLLGVFLRYLLVVSQCPSVSGTCWLCLSACLSVIITGCVSVVPARRVLVIPAGCVSVPVSQWYQSLCLSGIYSLCTYTRHVSVIFARCILVVPTRCVPELPTRYVSVPVSQWYL